MPKAKTKNTVADLIKLLQDLPPKALVVMSSDGEGNNFSPWAGTFCDGHYAPECSWTGDFVSGEDLDGRKVNAVVLWPTN